MQFRIGQGIDTHQLVKERALILGGVRIPHSKGLLGHSDADALTHSIIDAILGAAGKGDIGTWFPNTSVEWKDASSIEMLKKVWDNLKAEGWKINNIDCNILAETPKLNPHIQGMKNTLAEALQIEVSQLAIKAGTTEQMGFVGREEGIVAQSVVLLSR